MAVNAHEACVRILLIIFPIFLLGSCREKPSSPGTLFTPVPSGISGIDFENNITTDNDVNILNYEYLYNGAGIGVADFNNDGLPDIYFGSSQGADRIYLNEGRHEGKPPSFRDVTASAGISEKKGWSFGVSVVDINQDGLQDVYVCMAGPGRSNSFPNRLYVHQGLNKDGLPVFKEMAAEYGLNDRGHSIQSLFFDYDRDGDLDMYLLTGGGFDKSPNNPSPILTNGTASNTDKLYRNDGSPGAPHPVFKDVSREAGILEEGYGLGVSILDINDDGWMDLYVTNDYISNDHLYVNNRDGTFSNRILDYFKHTSHYAMGNDVGDINNDGLPDIVAVDMLPDDYRRRKLMFGPMQYNKFNFAVSHGYSHQYMRNTLQLNNGNGSFSEIGQLSGIYKTDWSWAALFADLDNDGFQDLYITNGFGKDVTDLDFVKFRSNVTVNVKNDALRRKILMDSLAARPGIKVHNYAFRNTGQLTFEDVSDKWGFESTGFSNGAAYADFDNDGDLDLVVNNIDQPAQLYLNGKRELEGVNHNFLKVKLIGKKGNSAGIGANVLLKYKGKIQCRLRSPVRGFQSSMDEDLHFGLGNENIVDTLEVHWPDGTTSLVTSIRANQTLNVSYGDNYFSPQEKAGYATIFETASSLPYRHIENDFIDFNHEPLLLHKLSQEGPGIAVGDVNGDHLQDVFVGGALLQPGTFLIQKKDGTFAARTHDAANRECEDMGTLLFDADNDGDLDLYVVSGGNEYNLAHRFYQDRMYFNDGKGIFSQDTHALPNTDASGSCVVAADFDRDGDLDLFVGGRVSPGAYPSSPRSYLLKNDGHGKFEDVTLPIAPGLHAPGMVTSALWTDFDNDNWIDLVVVGEFMPVKFFRNENGKAFTYVSGSGLANSDGWWNSITAGDFDNDQDIDYIAGNFGLNSHYKASPEKPVTVVYKDFDNNGVIEAITSYYDGDDNYPVASLDVLTQQLPMLKKHFLYHRVFAGTSTANLFELIGQPPEPILYCRNLQSSYIENLGNGKFKMSPLPLVMQMAPVYGVLVDDVDRDGNLDFLAVGNSFAPDVVSGRSDAMIGLTMQGDGKGNFSAMKCARSGFFVDGDAKGLARLDLKGGASLIIATQDNDSLAVLKRRNKDNLPMVSLKPSEHTAIITYKNGKTNRMEIGYGSTYLSQTSRQIRVTPEISRIDILGYNGQTMRSLTY